MPEENEGKKKYTVVDKRHLDGEPQAEAPAEAPAKEPETQTPPPADEPAAAQETPQDQRSPGIVDAFALILNLLREHALSSLGMSLPLKTEFNPDAASAEQAAQLFHSLISKFPDLLPKPEQMPDEPDFKPDFTSVLAMGLNVVQSQILIHMGLIADPASGLVVKDLGQAKTGIEIFAALVEVVSPMLPPQVAPQLEAALSDLRMNYVKALNTP